LLLKKTRNYNVEASGRSIARWFDFLLITSKGEQMKLRSRRLMPGLLAILVVLAIAPSSFAQISLTITPTPSPGEGQTNHAAIAQDPGQPGAGILVTGALLASSPLTTTTLSLTYSATITSSPLNCVFGSGADNPQTGTDCATLGTAHLIPTEDPIAVIGSTGVFATVTNPNLNTSSKRIDIDLPGFPSGNAASGSFRLLGVRIDMNGATAPVTETPSLSSAANNYLLTSLSPLAVVSATGASIASVSVGARTGSPSSTSQGTAAILTNRSVAKGTGSFVVSAGFAGAWRTATQNLTNSTGIVTTVNSSRILLTFSNVPSGVTITLSANPTVSTTSGKASAAFLATAGPPATTTPTAQITSTTNTATVEILSGSLTTTPQLEIDITGIALSSTAAVTTPGSISVTASMAPFCTTLLDAASLPIESNGYPCFTEAEVGPVTVVNILPTQTTLLMPYALTLPPYDTGIAIANTTADPFGTTGGGALPISGTVNLNFFPTTSTGGAGTPFSLTTSSTVRPGSGLSSDGTLASGATWTVLLSQLLTAAGQTGNFTGYVFITANFLDAHGTATISDFRTYSLTANVLVLPPPATASRSTPGAGFEGLHP